MPTLKKMLEGGVEGLNRFIQHRTHQNRWTRLEGKMIFGEGRLYSILVGLASASDPRVYPPKCKDQPVILLTMNLALGCMPR